MDALDYSDYIRIVETGENIGNENIDKIKKLIS
jgi:hypothetical protein